jgi:hypothetical protein
MPRARPDLELYTQRLELVKTYHRGGLSVMEITTRLDAAGLFSSQQSPEAKYRVVLRLLRLTQKQGRRDYAKATQDAKEELAMYLATQHFLYKQACSDGDWSLARDISKSIALAQGVDVDGVHRDTFDVGSLLKRVFPLLNGRKMPTHGRPLPAAGPP